MARNEFKTNNYGVSSNRDTPFSIFSSIPYYSVMSEYADIFLILLDSAYTRM